MNDLWFIGEECQLFSLTLGPVGCDGFPGPLLICVVLITLGHHGLLGVGAESHAPSRGGVHHLLGLFVVRPGAVGGPVRAPLHVDSLASL